MKILNLGSLNIDKTYKVEHLADADETIKASEYQELCGGRGLNQSIALARAGVDVYHAGCIGRDGNVLLETLKRSGVKTELIKKSGSVSGHAVIQVDNSGKSSIVIYGGANDEVSKEYIEEVLEHFSKWDLLLLQNEISNVAYAMEKADEKGILIAFNPTPMNDSVLQYDLQKVKYFILNEAEGKRLAGADTEDPEEIIKKLREKYPRSVIVLTLGDKGSCYTAGGRTIYQTIFKTNVVDTTGAGDTFTGYFLAGIADNMDPEITMKYASIASAISVSRPGVSPSIPTYEEVYTYIDH